MSMSAAQPELFAPPLLPGLLQVENVLTPVEEQRLIGLIDTVELSPFQFHGWLGKRLTASFGWRYDFDDASIQPAAPIPDWLLPLRERSAQIAGLRPDQFVQSLLVRYDPGAGIGWHRDRDVFEKVVGISLNTAATLRFRQRTATGFCRASVNVEPRSAYLISGESRWNWEHSIAPGDQLRFSITFRTLSDKGRRIADKA